MDIYIYMFGVQTHDIRKTVLIQTKLYMLYTY